MILNFSVYLGRGAIFTLTKYFIWGFHTGWYPNTVLKRSRTEAMERKPLACTSKNIFFVEAKSFHVYFLLDQKT